MRRPHCGSLRARLMLLTVVWLAAPTPSLADIRLPRDEAERLRVVSQPQPLIVRQSADAQEHRIVIPAGLLDELVKRRAPAGEDGKPVDGADGKAAALPIRSIVAAVSLSAAVASGLVVFGSRRGRSSRTLLVLGGVVVAAAAALQATESVFADLLDPQGGPRRPRIRPRPSEDEPAAEAGPAGRIVIEVQDGRDAVVLLLGRGGLPKP